MSTSKANGSSASFPVPASQSIPSSRACTTSSVQQGFYIGGLADSGRQVAAPVSDKDGTANSSCAVVLQATGLTHPQELHASGQYYIITSGQAGGLVPNNYQKPGLTCFVNTQHASATVGGKAEALRFVPSQGNGPTLHITTPAASYSNVSNQVELHIPDQPLSSSQPVRGYVVKTKPAPPFSTGLMYEPPEVPSCSVVNYMDQDPFSRANSVFTKSAVRHTDQRFVSPHTQSSHGGSRSSRKSTAQRFQSPASQDLVPDGCSGYVTPYAPSTTAHQQAAKSSSSSTAEQGAAIRELMFHSAGEKIKTSRRSVEHAQWHSTPKDSSSKEAEKRVLEGWSEIKKADGHSRQKGYSAAGGDAEGGSTVGGHRVSVTAESAILDLSAPAARTETAGTQGLSDTSKATGQGSDLTDQHGMSGHGMEEGPSTGLVTVKTSASSSSLVISHVEGAVDGTGPEVGASDGLMNSISAKSAGGSSVTTDVVTSAASGPYQAQVPVRTHNVRNSNLPLKKRSIEDSKQGAHQLGASAHHHQLQTHHNKSPRGHHGTGHQRLQTRGLGHQRSQGHHDTVHRGCHKKGQAKGPGQKVNTELQGQDVPQMALQQAPVHNKEAAETQSIGRPENQPSGEQGRQAAQVERQDENCGTVRLPEPAEPGMHTAGEPAQETRPVQRPQKPVYFPSFHGNSVSPLVKVERVSPRDDQRHRECADGSTGTDSTRGVGSEGVQSKGAATEQSRGMATGLFSVSYELTAEERQYIQQMAAKGPIRKPKVSRRKAGGTTRSKATAWKKNGVEGEREKNPPTKVGSHAADSETNTKSTQLTGPQESNMAGSDTDPQDTAPLRPGDHHSTKPLSHGDNQNATSVSPSVPQEAAPRSPTGHHQEAALFSPAGQEHPGPYSSADQGHPGPYSSADQQPYSSVSGCSDQDIFDHVDQSFGYAPSHVDYMTGHCLLGEQQTYLYTAPEGSWMQDQGSRGTSGGSRDLSEGSRDLSGGSREPSEETSHEETSREAVEGLMVRGHTLQLQEVSLTSIPPETSGGLADSVYEEDMVRGDTWLAAEESLQVVGQRVDSHRAEQNDLSLLQGTSGADRTSSVITCHPSDEGPEDSASQERECPDLVVRGHHLPGAHTLQHQGAAHEGTQQRDGPHAQRIQRGGVGAGDASHRHGDTESHNSSHHHGNEDSINSSIDDMEFRRDFDQLGPQAFRLKASLMDLIWKTKATYQSLKLDGGHADVSVPQRYQHLLVKAMAQVADSMDATLKVMEYGHKNDATLGQYLPDPTKVDHYQKGMQAYISRCVSSVSHMAHLMEDFLQAGRHMMPQAQGQGSHVQQKEPDLTPVSGGCRAGTKAVILTSTPLEDTAACTQGQLDASQLSGTAASVDDDEGLEVMGHQGQGSTNNQLSGGGRVEMSCNSAEASPNAGHGMSCNSPAASHNNELEMRKGGRAPATRAAARQPVGHCGHSHTAAAGMDRERASEADEPGHNAEEGDEDAEKDTDQSSEMASGATEEVCALFLSEENSADESEVKPADDQSGDTGGEGNQFTASQCRKVTGSKRKRSPLTEVTQAKRSLRRIRRTRRLSAAPPPSARSASIPRAAARDGTPSASVPHTPVSTRRSHQPEQSVSGHEHKHSGRRSPDEIIPPPHKRGFPYKAECIEIVEAVYNHDHSDAFRHKVSLDKVPDYLKVVHFPMTLDMILYKLRQNKYEELTDWVRDFKRLFWNLRLYMRRGEAVIEHQQHCDEVEQFFLDKLGQTFLQYDFSHISGSPPKPQVRHSPPDSSGQGRRGQLPGMIKHLLG